MRQTYCFSTRIVSRAARKANTEISTPTSPSQCNFSKTWNRRFTITALITALVHFCTTRPTSSLWIGWIFSARTGTVARAIAGCNPGMKMPEGKRLWRALLLLFFVKLSAGFDERRDPKRPMISRSSNSSWRTRKSIWIRLYRVGVNAKAKWYNDCESVYTESGISEQCISLNELRIENPMSERERTEWNSSNESALPSNFSSHFFVPQRTRIPPLWPLQIETH